VTRQQQRQPADASRSSCPFSSPPRLPPRAAPAGPSTPPAHPLHRNLPPPPLLPPPPAVARAAHTLLPPPLRPQPQVLTRDDASVWPGMSAAAKEGVKQGMLACLQEERQRAVTKKVPPGGWVGCGRVAGRGNVAAGMCTAFAARHAEDPWSGIAGQAELLPRCWQPGTVPPSLHRSCAAHVPLLYRCLYRQVCDCVSELAAGIVEDQGWPELLPAIFQLVQSGGWYSACGFVCLSCCLLERRRKERSMLSPEVMNVGGGGRDCEKQWEGRLMVQQRACCVPPSAGGFPARSASRQRSGGRALPPHALPPSFPPRRRLPHIFALLPLPQASRRWLRARCSSLAAWPAT
jgi:hypothetical protein